MPATITTPLHGRGAFPLEGTGGTLDSKGQAPGRYYVAATAPTGGKAPPMVGLTGFRANRDSRECTIDEYAVWRSVIAIQTQIGVSADGLFGSATGAKLKEWQQSRSLNADGVFGSSTGKALFGPLVLTIAAARDAAHPDLGTIMRGLVSVESGWDPGAVGRSDPRDLGLCQINGPAHPDMDVDSRLDPVASLWWMANFCGSNLVAMRYDTRDSIAAYNLGVQGARNWIAAGRPDVWTPPGSSERNMKYYIDQVLLLGGS